MYAQHQNLPEQYAGNAFADCAQPSDRPHDEHQSENERDGPSDKCADCPAGREELCTPRVPRRAEDGIPGGLFGGNEELLLIGLLFLLLRDGKNETGGPRRPAGLFGFGGENGDLLLLLALLFFGGK